MYVAPITFSVSRKELLHAQLLNADGNKVSKRDSDKLMTRINSKYYLAWLRWKYCHLLGLTINVMGSFLMDLNPNQTDDKIVLANSFEAL